MRGCGCWAGKAGPGGVPSEGPRGRGGGPLSWAGPAGGVAAASPTPRGLALPGSPNLSVWQGPWAPVAFPGGWGETGEECWTPGRAGLPAGRRPEAKSPDSGRPAPGARINREIGVSDCGDTRRPGHRPGVAERGSGVSARGRTQVSPGCSLSKTQVRQVSDPQGPLVTGIAPTPEPRGDGAGPGLGILLAGGQVGLGVRERPRRLPGGDSDSGEP